jgi:hypothetical protein
MNSWTTVKRGIFNLAYGASKPYIKSFEILPTQAGGTGVGDRKIFFTKGSMLTAGLAPPQIRLIISFHVPGPCYMNQAD